MTAKCVKNKKVALEEITEFSNRSQMTSKYGKNKKVAHQVIAECVTHVVTTF